MAQYTLKHTPGEWSQTGLEIRHKNRSIIIANVYKHLPLNMSTEEQKANAQLIATAPELLETLIGTMNALSRMIDKHDSDSIESEWIGNAHEVITKATIQNQ